MKMVPTRIADNSITMIDLCISNLGKKNISCDINEDDQISDHFLLDIKIKGSVDHIPIKIDK